MREVFIQLGRNGDLILLLPCWWKIWQESGFKPVVVVAKEFAGVLRGVSYVEPDPVEVHWYGGMPRVKQMAALKYGEYVVTQCHGVGHETDQEAYGTFGEAMWAKAGYAGRYGEFPMVFDRRDLRREMQLAHRLIGTTPVVLYNFSGVSSPFGPAREVRARMQRWARQFTLVNLALVRAVQLYDLLGLYDRAVGLITSDTATLHLAAASKVPMLAYCRGGWSSSVPKPGAIRVEYGEALSRLEVVDEFMQGLYETKPTKRDALGGELERGRGATVADGAGLAALPAAS